MADRLRPTVPAYCVISIKTAQKHSEPLRAGALKNGHTPTEVGRVADRAAQRKKEPFKLCKVAALIAVHIFDVHVADVLLNGIDIRRLVGVAALRHRSVEIAARHAGEGEKSLVFFPQSAGSKRRNRRRIEPATEH